MSWHYANYRGDELLVVGHSPRRNDCILVRLSGLPMNEAGELRKIAQSQSGQETERLVSLLQRLHAPDRTADWFTYLCRKMEQRNSPVFTLPLKEIQDSLDEDQRAIFKGYGKGRLNKAIGIAELARDQGGVEIADELPDLMTSPVNTPASSGLENKMDVMLTTLVDEGHRTQQLLNRLIGALTEVDDPTPTPKPAPKPRRSSRKREQQEVQAL
jgi:hypothetical protein